MSIKSKLMTSQDTTCRHTVYLYVQILIFHITHLEYSSYAQTLFMGFLLLSEQNTMKLLLNSYMSYFTSNKEPQMVTTYIKIITKFEKEGKRIKIVEKKV
jgi:hypothetical protein